jgi:hypothetical protein
MPYRIVAVAVVILALIHVAEACGCIETDVHEDVKKADVVVRGKVVDINDAYTDAITEMIQPAKRIVVIRVSRVWKGAIGETFEFAETAVSPLASCTPSWQSAFAVGNDVLVFAQRSPSNHEFVPMACSHTGRVNDSGKNIRELGRGKAPRKRRRKVAS